ncbi:MAG: GntR family transcriptional regulator [Candidatus Ratteibacteria bacterium]
MSKVALKRSVPLYYQIQNILKKEIEEERIKPGEAIPSLYTLAETYGVSLITVRQAVSNLMNEGMLYVINGKGTFVAERPFKKVTIGIALDIDGADALVGDISLDRTLLVHVREWMDCLSMEGSAFCFPLYIPLSLHKKALLQFIRDNHVEGIVILHLQRAEKALELAIENNIPYVVLGELEKKEPEERNFVIYSNYTGAVKAAEYLLIKGHRRIGILIGTMSYYGYRERLAGYKDTLALHKIDPNNIVEVPCESGVAGGYAAVKKMLADTSVPTALLCSSDFKAIGAIRAIQEVGLRIPEDIAVIGYDGLPLRGGSNVHLTTIRIPKKEMIREGIQFLLDSKRRKNGEIPFQKEVEPELMQGETT